MQLKTPEIPEEDLEFFKPTAQHSPQEKEPNLGKVDNRNYRTRGRGAESHINLGDRPKSMFSQRDREVIEENLDKQKPDA